VRLFAAAVVADQAVGERAAARTAGTLLEALLRVREIDAFVALLRAFEALALDPHNPEARLLSGAIKIRYEQAV
jgi:Flp pilus assembly protein TadD